MRVSLDISDALVREVARNAHCGYWAALSQREGSMDLSVLVLDTDEGFRVSDHALGVGLHLMAIHSPKHFADILADNARDGRAYQCDGTTGDLLLQYACFGKVVYA